MKKIAKTPFTSYQKFVIFILAITQFTVILDFMVMSPLGDILMKSLNMKPAQFGIAVSGYAISAGISGFLTAGFADRFDRKRLLLFFYAGFILGTIFCGISTTYPVLVAARIITGLFGGVLGSVAMAIIIDLFAVEQRGRVMGYVQMGLGVSQVLGIPIGLYLANHLGWQSPFWMISALSVLIFLFIMIKLRPVTDHLAHHNDKNAFLHLLHTIQKKEYRVGFAATALLSIGGFMMMPFGAAFARNNLGVTKDQLPILFMVAGCATLVVMPLVGKLSDRIDRFKLFAAGCIWMVIVVLIYTHLSITPLWICIIFNIVMMIGIMSRMVPAGALTTSIPEMKDRGAYMSINGSLQQIAGGIAAIIGGMIVVQKTKTSPLEHYDTLGYVVISITLISIFLIYRVSELVKKKAAATPVAPPKVEDDVLNTGQITLDAENAVEIVRINPLPEK